MLVASWGTREQRAFYILLAIVSCPDPRPKGTLLCSRKTAPLTHPLTLQIRIPTRLQQPPRLRHDAGAHLLRVQQVERQVHVPGVHAEPLRFHTQHQLLHMPRHQVRNRTCLGGLPGWSVWSPSLKPSPGLALLDLLCVTECVDSECCVVGCGRLSCRWTRVLMWVLSFFEAVGVYVLQISKEWIQYKWSNAWFPLLFIWLKESWWCMVWRRSLYLYS